MKYWFLSFIIATSALLGGVYLWERAPAVRSVMIAGSERLSTSIVRIESVTNRIIKNQRLSTLEIRFFPEDIIKNNRELITALSEGRLRSSKLVFLPHILIDVKYTRDGIFSDGATKEGVMLWSLMDGEMVLDTATWDRTSGFEDCLMFRADSKDLQVLKALSVLGGVATFNSLSEMLLEESVADVDLLINTCKEKKLILTHGNKLRLHFKHPRLEIEPTTNMRHPIVSYKKNRDVTIVSPEYSLSQVRNLTEIVFGSDFVIRRTKKVFLPVYCISIVNLDGSVWTGYWNAVNSRRLDLRI